MHTKYGIDITEAAIDYKLHYLINKVFKLLPLREEQKDWQTHLATTINTIVGFKEVLQLDDKLLIDILSELEGLYTIQDFSIYRNIIFSCISKLGEVKQCLYKD